METIGNLIYTILNDDADLNELVADRIYPLIASQKADVPFITYTISENPAYSKANQFEYDITIACFEKDYNKAVQLSNAVSAAIIDSVFVFTYLGTQPQYHNEQLISVNRNYKFKN